MPNNLNLSANSVFATPTFDVQVNKQDKLNIATNVVFNLSEFDIKVNKEGGRLISTTPITVKNQIQEIRSIDDIPKVNTALKAHGATLLYNSTTGYYDVKVFDPAVVNVAIIYISTLIANNSTGSNGQILTSNGNTVYWADNYPGEANTATFFNGIIDCGEY